MGSSRLPGKVLQDIAGQPMLSRVVERTRRAKTVSQVVVATTTEAGDDPIAAYCASRTYPCYRGSLYDVLDRYYQAALQFSAQVIVRITADCPLIDPVVVDTTVNAFLGVPGSKMDIANRPLGLATDRSYIPATNPQFLTPGSAPDTWSGTPDVSYDFAANRLPPPWGRTYPIGLDTEVCTFQALETAWKEAHQPHEREHVMPFFYEHQERFRILLVNYEHDYGSLRWTVDTPEDLELVRQVFARFPGREDFNWLEVLDLFRQEPELAEINAQVEHKHYRQIDHRLESLK